MEKREHHPLSSRHFKQVICRPGHVQKAMRSVWAMTWRPGDKTNSFLGKLFRPLMSPVLVAQSSHQAERHGKPREQVLLRGVKAQVDPRTAEVYFGGNGAGVFEYDFGLRPFPGAKGQILDPERNPSMVQLGLELDALRQRMAVRSFRLPVVPRLPEIYLGFAETTLPPMEDTPALRQRIATHMHRSPTEVDGMHDDDRNLVMRAEWQELFIPPTRPDNCTGHWLINHRYCTAVTRALRIYAGFQELLGADVWNPVRDLIGGRIPNPATAVAADLGISLDASFLGNLDEGEIAPLVAKMRERLGDNSRFFTDDDICNGIVNHEDELEFSVSPLDRLGEAETIAAMRQKLSPGVSECCADADLLAAAAKPASPLTASGMCRAQLLGLPPGLSPDVAFRFTANELGRPRVVVDLWASQWRERRERHEVVEPVVADAPGSSQELEYASAVPG